MATKKAKTKMKARPATTLPKKAAGVARAAAKIVRGALRTSSKSEATETSKRERPARSVTRAPSDEALESAAAPAGVQVGDAAPSFALRDDSGGVLSSESLRGSPYVLYFYPKDDTPGCTLEACGFRDAMPRFDAKGVRILGVSADSPEAHARFKKKYGLTFPLLSDPEKTLAKAYGVWVKKKNYGREYLGIERSTFYVDRRGVVQKVWRSVRVPGHVDTVSHSV